VVSDLATPNVELCCIIILTANPAEIRRRLNAQYVEETLMCANIYDWYNILCERHKKFRAALSWQDHGKCVLGFMRNWFMFISFHMV
jgi:hypothetical protein